MYEIEVSRVTEEQPPSRFHVRVADGDGSSTEHDVSLSRSDHKRLGGGYPSPEAFIQACFAFLLQREPKDSILRSFDVSQISTYFPEFDQEILRDQDG
ncbi:MAG: hypothetical protein ACXWEJ_05965 [Actinomycetota bacterium]